jgi:hypothetical protein
MTDTDLADWAYDTGMATAFEIVAKALAEPHPDVDRLRQAFALHAMELRAKVSP